MKRNIFLIVLCFVILTISISSICYAEEQIHIKINGVEVKFDFQKPVIIDKQTFVSYKEVFDKLGYDSTWNSKDNTVTVSEFGFAIKSTVGSDKLIKITYKNGTKKERTIKINALPCVINNRPMVPLGAFLKELGIPMRWDVPANTINITSDRVVSDSSSANGIFCYSEFPGLPSFKNIVNIDPISTQTNGNDTVYSYAVGYLTDMEFNKYAEFMQNNTFGYFGAASDSGGLTIQNKMYKIVITYNPNDTNLRQAVYVITVTPKFSTNTE